MEFFKKNASLTKTVITILIFTVFYMFIFMVDDSSTDNFDETVTTVGGSGETYETPTDTSVNETRSVTLGQTVDFKGVKYTLERAYLYDGSDSEFAKPEPGMEFLVLDYKVENDTSEEIYGGSFDVYVYANGKAASLSYSDKNTLTSKMLLPSTYLNATDSFEVPKGSNTFQVRVSCYATEQNFDSEAYVYNFTIE